MFRKPPRPPPAGHGFAGSSTLVHPHARMRPMSNELRRDALRQHVPNGVSTLVAGGNKSGELIPARIRLEPVAVFSREPLQRRDEIGLATRPCVVQRDDAEPSKN